MIRRAALVTVLPPALALLLVYDVVAPASGQRRSAGDPQIVDQATLVASGDRVEIYQHASVTPGFLKTAIAVWSL